MISSPKKNPSWLPQKWKPLFHNFACFDIFLTLKTIPKELFENPATYKRILGSVKKHLKDVLRYTRELKEKFTKNRSITSENNIFTQLSYIGEQLKQQSKFFINLWWLSPQYEYLRSIIHKYQSNPDTLKMFIWNAKWDISSVIDLLNIQEKSLQKTLKELDNSVNLFVTKKFDIGKEIFSLIQEKKSYEEHKKISLFSTVPSGIKIDSYPIVFSFVLENLLSNAIKFTPPGWSIHIWVESKAPSSITIFVENDGEDISPSKNIFKPWYTTPGREGEKWTWVGLPSCDNQLRKIRGTIRHTPRKKWTWAKFFCRIPFAEK